MEKLAALLIAAHAICDFSLQPDSLLRRKKNILFLMLHAMVHAALVYLFLQAWTCWQSPALMFASHSLIDFIKQRIGKESAKAFLIDQSAHFLSLMTVAWILVETGWLPDFTGVGYKVFIVSAGFILTVQGSEFLITKLIKRLLEDNDLELDGLKNGGKWIGQLERSLIFLFIFIGQPAGIGFLVAAKSILRFEEAKKQKMAEYVLIGTLLSFSLGIALTSLTKWAVGF
ncbi:MAG: DUF3307 domain-containing protein [Candidatus Aminicenantes bacterium]|nr:DUF3307 domain-containing protein [Candidatus Aminicenantes bacterium]